MRRLLLATVVLALLLGGGLCAARFAWLTPDRLRSFALEAAQRAFAGRVDLASVRWTGLATLDVLGLKLSSPDGVETWVDIPALHVTPSLTGLLEGRLRIAFISVEGAVLDLKQEPSGHLEIERYLRPASPTVRLTAPDSGSAAGPSPPVGTPPPAPTLPQLASAGTTSRPVVIDRWVIHGSKLLFASKDVSFSLSRIESAGSVDDTFVVQGISARLFDRFGVTGEGSLVLDTQGSYRFKASMPEANLAELIAQVPSMSWWMMTAGEKLSALMTLRVDGQGDRGNDTLGLSVDLRDLDYASPGLLACQVTAKGTRLGVAYRRSGQTSAVDGTLDMTAPGVQPTGYPQPVAFEKLNGTFDWTAPVLRIKTLHVGGSGAGPSSATAAGGREDKGVLDGAGFVNLARMPPDYELSFEGSDLSAAAVLGPVWTAAAVVRGTRAEIAGRLLPGELSLRLLGLRLPAAGAGTKPAGAGPVGPQWGTASATRADEPSISLRGTLKRGMGGVWGWRDGAVRMRTDVPALFALLGLVAPPISGSVVLEGGIEGTTTAATLRARVLPSAVQFGHGGALIPVSIADGLVSVGGGSLRLDGVQLQLSRAPMQISGEMTSTSRRLGLNFVLFDANWIAIARAIGLAPILEGRGSMTGALGIDDRGYDGRMLLALAPCTLFLRPIPGLTGDGRIACDSLKATISLESGRLTVTDIDALATPQRLSGGLQMSPDGKLEGTLYVRPGVAGMPVQAFAIAGKGDAPVIAPPAGGGGRR